MKIGVIGAGRVGGTLGRGLARAGHEVAYGVRSPADESGEALRHERATVVSVREAAAGADAIILATPWAATEAALASAGDLAGKLLIDVTNPIGPGFQLTHGHTDSGAEQVARWARGARVVKAFNVTGAENMGDPVYGQHRVAAFVCGDDPGSCELVAGLAGELGFDVTVVGKLDKARLLEPVALLWIHMAITLKKGRNMAFGVLRREGLGRAQVDLAGGLPSFLADDGAAAASVQSGDES